MATRLTLVLALAVAVLCVAHGDDISEQYDRTAHQMSELLQIRSQMQRIYSPFARDPTATKSSEVRDLGDTAEQPAALTDGRTAALLQLDQVLDSFSPGRTDLGESRAAHPTVVDRSRLKKLLGVPEDGQVTEAVERLTYFLKKQLHEHRTLSRSELDSIRQFYIDQTADTLARYGYEDSPYGQNDVSVRRGDAVAARKHMDKQDELMHTAGTEGGASNANVAGVLKNLKETAYLSEFLDRLTQDARQVEDTAVQPEQTSDDPAMSQLESLQSDEESITAGIEQLLASIKKGKPMEVADAFTHKHDQKLDHHDTLEARADKETSRLDQLEAELKAEDAGLSKKKPAAGSKPVVHVPLPKLERHLNGYISEKLDHTLKRFKTLQHDGYSVDPALKAKIEQYMSRITANLLNTCVSYEQWNQPRALDEESEAVDHGDPDELSRLHAGTHLGSHKIVQEYIQQHLQPPTQAAHTPTIMRTAAVPWKLQTMMQKGVHLAGVGNLVVTLKKP